MSSYYTCGTCGHQHVLPEGLSYFQCAKCRAICIVDKEKFMSLGKEENDGKE